jgi:hypothetical protein
MLTYASLNSGLGKKAFFKNIIFVENLIVVAKK